MNEMPRLQVVHIPNLMVPVSLFFFLVGTCLQVLPKMTQIAYSTIQHVVSLDFWSLSSSSAAHTWCKGGCIVFFSPSFPLSLSLVSERRP